MAACHLPGGNSLISILRNSITTFNDVPNGSCGKELLAAGKVGQAFPQYFAVGGRHLAVPEANSRQGRAQADPSDDKDGLATRSTASGAKKERQKERERAKEIKMRTN